MAFRTGVYLLVGPDPENPLRDKVYIGEGDNVLTRLTAHDKDESKDFWTRCAIIISKDENLTKAHGRYLESRLIALVRAADRAALHNGTEPDTLPLPEPVIADMEFFLEQMQQMLPVLGMTFLQPLAVLATATTGGTFGGAARETRFQIDQVGVRAYAVETNGEFVVLEGIDGAQAGDSLLGELPGFARAAGGRAQTRRRGAGRLLRFCRECRFR